MNSVKIMCLVLLISEIGKLTFNTFISQASLTFMWSKWGGGGGGVGWGGGGGDDFQNLRLLNILLFNPLKFLKKH